MVFEDLFYITPSLHFIFSVSFVVPPKAYLWSQHHQKFPSARIGLGFVVWGARPSSLTRHSISSLFSMTQWLIPRRAARLECSMEQASVAGVGLGCGDLDIATLRSLRALFCHPLVSLQTGCWPLPWHRLVINRHNLVQLLYKGLYPTKTYQNKNHPCQLFSSIAFRNLRVLDLPRAIVQVQILVHTCTYRYKRWSKA